MTQQFRLLLQKSGFYVVSDINTSTILTGGLISVPDPDPSIKKGKITKKNLDFAV